MSLFRKLAGTASVQFFAKGITLVSGVVFARVLGPEQYGLYALTLSVVTLLTIPAIAGLPNLIIRNIAIYLQDENWKLLKGIINWSRLYVALVSIAVMGGLYVAIYFDLIDSGLASLLVVGGVVIPIKGFIFCFGAVLNAYKRTVSSIFFTQVFAQVLTLFLTVVLFFYGENLKAITLYSMLGCSLLLSLILCVLYMRKVHPDQLFSVKPEYLLGSWYKSLLPFSLLAIVATLNVELASVIVGWMIGNENVAYLKIATHGVAVISLGLQSINMVIMPGIAQEYKSGNMGNVQDLATKGVRASAIISFPILMCLAFYGDFFISILFGSDYLDAYPLLIILCLGQCFNVAMGSVGVVLNMTGNEYSSLGLLSAVFLFNVLCYCAFIPVFGEVGAAVSISLSHVVFNILAAVVVRKKTGIITWLR